MFGGPSWVICDTVSLPRVQEMLKLRLAHLAACGTAARDCFEQSCSVVLVAAIFGGQLD